MTHTYTIGSVVDLGNLNYQPAQSTKLLTAAQFAERAQISVSKARRLFAAEGPGIVRVGQSLRMCWEQWLESNSHPGRTVNTSGSATRQPSRQQPA